MFLEQHIIMISERIVKSDIFDIVESGLLSPWGNKMIK